MYEYNLIDKYKLTKIYFILLSKQTVNKERSERYNNFYICTAVKKTFLMIQNKPTMDNLQQNIHFYKTKFGLYKTINYVDKRIKDDIYRILNYIKYEEINTYKIDLKKRPKTLFSKKFNKLFFRAGRRVLLNKFNFKKTIIQKYFSKKIHHFIKKPNLNQLENNSLNALLIRCNLFYTLNDSNSFITKFGVQINDKITYDNNCSIYTNDFISIIWFNSFFKIFKKKKTFLTNNLKKLKTYKFRLKHFLTKKKVEWMPIKTWLSEYSCLYLNKYSNMEFDIKTLTGVCLYNNYFSVSMEYYYNIDLSMFMSRSYTWKYII